MWVGMDDCGWVAINLSSVAVNAGLSDRIVAVNVGSKSR